MRVINVEIPGHRQLLANKAYLNSSSQTTCSFLTRKVESFSAELNVDDHI
jgi:hypothetical protein